MTETVGMLGMLKVRMQNLVQPSRCGGCHGPLPAHGHYQQQLYCTRACRIAARHKHQMQKPSTRSTRKWYARFRRAALAHGVPVGTLDG